MVELITDELRDQFEEQLLIYVNSLKDVHMTKDEVVARRGAGHYEQHHLTQSMWFGFLVSKFGAEYLVKELGLVVSH